MDISVFVSFISGNWLPIGETGGPISDNSPPISETQNFASKLKHSICD
ncbi:hypothetical protein QNK12_27555 [Neobacillus cucumis]|nr:hypothetical protein QNK12_27555 [Neobacillus cucumis]